MLDISEAIRLSWEMHSLHKQCMSRLLYNQSIHFGQPPLLFALKQQGGTCNQKDLAKELKVSPAAIAVSLKRMEKAGLVLRIQNPNDLRSNRVELTERGLHAAEQARLNMRKVMEKAFSSFSDEDYDQFISLYQQMCNNLKNFKNQLDELEESL